MTDHNDHFPRAVWEGTFTIFGVELRCAVLDNGLRVINADDVHVLAGVMLSGEMVMAGDDFEAFVRWQRAGVS